MAFTDKDREKIRGFGLSDQTIDFVLSQNSKDRAEADEAGVDSKESADDELVEKDTEEVVTEETEAVDETEEDTEEDTEEVTEEDSDSIELDSEDIADAIVQTMTAIAEVAKQVAELKASNELLRAEVKELKRSDAEKIADIKEATPWASQQELMQKSVVEGAGRLDGRTSLAKNSGPKEADSQPEPIVGIPMVDQFLRQDRA